VPTASLSVMKPIRFFCWLHACLHKIEGDSGNSRYWYAKAHRSFDDFTDPKSELEAIRAALA